MNVYLVQHGKPVSKEKDPERPLSDRGKDDVGKMASFLKKAGIKVDAIFHSGKTRAKQTAEIMFNGINSGGELLKKAGLSPLDDVKAIADEIMQGQNDVMIVGHLPHLARLTSFLTTGSESNSVVDFQQGGVVCLKPVVDHGMWAIAWMLVPEIVTSS